MIALESRHVPVVLVLAVLLLLPLVRARFDVRRTDDCARPDALRELGRVPGGLAAEERWDRYDEDLRQWTEVELAGNGRGVALRGALLRSYQASDLYTRPPRFLLGTFEAGEREVETVQAGDVELPIQSIRDATHRRNGIASWLFVYDGEPVRHPILAQLASAPEQVWSGARPLSLLIVAGTVPRGREEAARERARDWLVEAFAHHREACAPAP